MTTRAEFMTRIRTEMAKTKGLFPAATAERPAAPGERLALLRRELAERWPAALARFREEFTRVGGVFYRVGKAPEVPAVVAAIATQTGSRRLVSWHPQVLGADWTADLAARGLALEAMPSGAGAPDERRALRGRIAAADLGLTGVDLAVAETGTLVLVSGAGRPRSTSLLPAIHVAVFGRTALVESLTHVGLVLEAWHEGGRDDARERGASINFITGPSRTADIELTLTRGVHGPKEVHAIFVDEGLPETPHV
ncbi:MAG TPA: lactate utilization protein [Methylomirabilota bacterium]|jgi:L-lactate dehydrogenase complex protein LldG|nr:lactate utilization protein [Methylomirabilota bacterium]